MFGDTLSEILANPDLHPLAGDTVLDLGPAMRDEFESRFQKIEPARIRCGGLLVPPVDLSDEHREEIGRTFREAMENKMLALMRVPSGFFSAGLNIAASNLESTTRFPGDDPPSGDSMVDRCYRLIDEFAAARMRHDQLMKEIGQQVREAVGLSDLFKAPPRLTRKGYPIPRHKTRAELSRRRVAARMAKIRADREYKERLKSMAQSMRVRFDHSPMVFDRRLAILSSASV